MSFINCEYALIFNQKTNCDVKRIEKFEDTPLLQAVYTSFGFAVLNLFGWLREALLKFGIEKRAGKEDSNESVCVLMCKLNYFLFNF